MYRKQWYTVSMLFFMFASFFWYLWVTFLNVTDSSSVGTTFFLGKAYMFIIYISYMISLMFFLVGVFSKEIREDRDG